MKRESRSMGKNIKSKNEKKLIKDLDALNKGTRSLLGQAGEKIEKGDAVMFDPKTGLIVRAR